MSTAEKPKYKVIGTRPIRHDGVDKVTGRAKYGGDVQQTGLLAGVILRSPHAHAKILSIDTTKAMKVPGVRAIATGADLPKAPNEIEELGEGAVNLAHLSRNVLAKEKVLYKGHAVAGVAADTVHAAEEAARLIEVKYEVLPCVLTAPEAMKPGAPILLDDLRTESVAGQSSDGPTNVAKHFHFEKGDVAKGFAEAKVIVEREFNTATVHQGYIEPHNATAFWSADGQITVWMSTQGTFSARHQTALLLDVPVSKVKVVPMEIGGGFGGKISVYLPPVAAVLSKKTGRPVKILMDRAACFEATGPTPGCYMKVKIGADAQGKITAAEAYIAFEAGGFPGSPVAAGSMCVFACYDVPNGKVDGYDVVVNKPRTNAYRAPGSTNVAFATETVLDEIAAQLKIDPLEIRIRNTAKEGTRRVDGPVYSRIGMLETVKAIQESDHWRSPLTVGSSSGLHGKGTTRGGSDAKRVKRGRGVASGFWFNAGLKSAVSATLNQDGTVGLLEGSTDIGGSRTGIAMQFAETLGITAEDVVPQVVDTDSIGYTDVTGGSRVTYATGWAAYNAALDIRTQLVERAAMLWECPVEKVEFLTDLGNGKGGVKGPEGKTLTVKELAEKVQKHGEPIIGRGVSDKNEPGGAFATTCIDVEVDEDTGKVEVTRVTIAQDAGTAIHPSYVEGQMQGGTVQGIGWGLNEEYFYDKTGVMKNASYLDYRIPTCYDLPMIETIIVEVPNPGHPYGVRGTGEVPIVPPPAALANAIAQAVGVRMVELPMSPPKVLKAILSK